MKNLSLLLCLWGGYWVQLFAQHTLFSPSGFTPPSLSYTAIQVLPGSVKGVIVFDNTNNVLRFYNGTKWAALTGTQAVQGGSNPAAGTTALTASPKSLTLPRLTYTAITALASPAKGTMVFDVTNSVPRIYTGSAWATLSSTETEDNEAPLAFSAWKAGGEENDTNQDVAVDALGNVYITGSIIGTATFGATTITSEGYNDAYVAKYNSSGVLQWVKTLGTESGAGDALAVDASGNVYITGTFYGSAHFGTGNPVITATGLADIFIAKYTTNGVFQWAKQAGGSADDFGTDISVDGNGNAIITGNFSETATFGAVSLVSAGLTEAFVAKYNTSGTLQWAKKMGGPSIDAGNGVATDAAGNIYLTGEFSATATFESTNITAYSDWTTDIFIVKYNAAGTLQWVKQAGDQWEDTGSSIAVNAAGTTVYVTGLYQIQARFGAASIDTEGGTGSSMSIFLTKYQSDGTAEWVLKAGNSTANEFIGNLAMDINGYVYLAGSFWGAGNFGMTALLSAGANDAFVVKYNGNGTAEWKRRAGGTGEDYGRGVAVDANGRVYLAGEFTGTAAVGTGTVVSAGGADAYVMKITPP